MTEHRGVAARGAYGLALPDLRGADALLQPVPAGWPEWRIAHRARGEGEPDELDMLGPDEARLALGGGGWVEVERERSLSTLVLHERPGDAEIVHPYLALTAAVTARWNGWQCFHAGAVVVDGKAWAVIGDKGAGKSSALGWFALRSEAQMLTDDVLVVNADGAGIAGPRCVDLRGDMATHLGAGEPLGVVGARERWRLQVGPSPSEVPLTGWVKLAWGDRVEVERLGMEERLRTVSGSLALKVVPPNPAALMDLVGLPGWRLTRPRELGSTEEAGERLVATLAG